MADTLLTDELRNRGIRAKYLYTYSSSNTANSLAHIAGPLTVGDVYETLFADTNKVPGSGGYWEVTGTSAGTASDSLTVTRSTGSGVAPTAVMQGTNGRFKFVQNESEVNPAQFFVNTMGGTSQGSKFNKVRDFVLDDFPYRSKLKGKGQIIVGAGSNDGYDLLHASVDFGLLQFLENSAGTPGPLVKFGDTVGGTPGLSLASRSEVKLYVQGNNEGPGTTSGPGGIKGYDFQGAPSQTQNGFVPSVATGVFMKDNDSIQEIDLYVSRLKTGVQVEGNTEKQKIKISGAYCKTLLQDYVTTGSPDTNRFEITGTVCTTWLKTSTETTGHYIFNVESRLCDGTTFPASYNSNILIPTPGVWIDNGKQVKISGEFRGNNGPNYIYVDRTNTSDSTAKNGSDTVRFDGVTGVHTYGEFLTVDRVQRIEGLISAKDAGPGRLHMSDLTSTIDCGTFRINRVEHTAANLRMTAVDCYAKAAFWFGDVTKGLFSTNITFGGINAHMTSGGLQPVKVGGGKYSIIVEKAVGCTFPVESANANILLKADAVDNRFILPDMFVRLGCAVEFEAGATAQIQIRGSLTVAQMNTMNSWAPAGTRVESVSDMGGRPAIYNGTAWTYPTYA